MTDPLRRRLNARVTKTLIETKASFGHLTEAQKKTPSQRNSERLRKKLNRGRNKAEPPLQDCRDCFKYPCGKTLAMCDERATTARCPRCGLKVVYRFIINEPWKGCPSCR